MLFKQIQLQFHFSYFCFLTNSCCLFSKQTAECPLIWFIKDLRHLLHHLSLSIWIWSHHSFSGNNFIFSLFKKVDSNARTYSRTYNRDKKIRTLTMYVKLDDELELLSYNDEHQSRAEVRTNCLSPLTFIILKVVHRTLYDVQSESWSIFQ